MFIYFVIILQFSFISYSAHIITGIESNNLEKMIGYSLICEHIFYFVSFDKIHLFFLAYVPIWYTWVHLNVLFELFYILYVL